MNISTYTITLFSTRKQFSFQKTRRKRAKLPSALTLMAIQTRKQLLAELEEAGLDEDELDLLQHELELELDPGADDYDESDDDQHVVMASSSTVHGSPSPPAPQQPARTPVVSTVPRKRKRGPRKNISPEVIDDDEDVAGSRKHDCILARRF
jgi:hypothetical protein